MAVLGLLAAGVVLAAPAAAVDDPARPDARVTHGPSCRPGGVVVEVTAGTVPYAVTLATGREPGGEDSAELQPGEVVVLRTGDVAWGERIDSRLEYAALDGSGETHVDELEGFVFTRPAEEDCAAIAAPPGAGDVPPAGVPPADGATPSAPPATPPAAAPVPPDAAPDAAPAPVPPSGAAPAPAGAPVPAPAGAPGTPAGDAVPPGGAVVASAGAVAAGQVVTLTGAGFAPGEAVTVRLAGGEVLATVPAGPDGALETSVRLPGGTAGATTLELVGADSAVTAAVEVRVAAATGPAGAEPPAGQLPVPLVAAGVALLLSASGLVVTAGRRGRARRVDTTRPTGSA